MPFVDEVRGGECVLVVPAGGKVFPRSGEPKIGVVHPHCVTVADLALHLDAFFCPACHRNGRISGFWAADVIKAASSP